MSKTYFEIHITTEKQELNEYLMAEMADLGFETFVESEDGFTAYIPGELYNCDALTSLDSFAKTKAKFTASEIEQQNWNSEWEKNFDPVEVDDFCGIRAPFHQAFTNKKYEIIIEPKMSFGTGHHETTSMMIRLMSHLDFKGKSVLDMGCGTSVLAILAAKMGAARIVAIDNDEWAYENSIENVEKNVAGAVNIFLGDASLLKQFTDQKIDIILANINRNILLNDMVHYSSVLANGGHLLLSGFYRADRPVILDHCKQFSLKETRFVELHDWTALSLIKNND
jgi:ribosomal protein L11 methyltransferase